MPDSQPIRTLYVDDEELARTAFKRAMEQRGFDVTPAASGFEARRLAETDRYDLVVSDLRMPGMDGITLASALERAGVEAAFVLVSGVPELDFRRRSAENIFAIVPKPWDGDSLAQTLHHAAQFQRDRLQGHGQPDDVLFLMLIEDSGRDAAVIESHLSEQAREHYQIVRVSQAREAIARLREAVFPVIITDLSLPDARGIDAVQRLREEAPDSAIIVVSDKDDDALGHRVIALGAQEFLVKEELHLTNIARVIGYAHERKRAERRLAHLANRDPVTGLANRQHFNSRLVSLMRRARRKARPFGVIYVDLDSFKPINDTFGHDAGDRVLEIVGERISQTVRDYDVCARLGGDEFAVLAEEPTDREGVARMCERLVEELSLPMDVMEREVAVSASIGAAMYPDFGESPEELLKAADSAMYQAKQRGGSRVCIRTNEGHGLDADLETRVRTAVENEEFHLNFQPQFDVRSGCVVGVEALLRWERSPGEMVSPAVFVPVLENTGLIVQVGAWVVHEMCRQLKRWDAMGLNGIRGAVNVAPRQFESGDLVSTVRDALEKTGLDASRLEVEITESTLMRNTLSSNTTLQSLKELGVRVAIDDFGTGYSSLSYLHRFKVDVLKIDRSFIREVGNDRNGEAIASAIVSLSHRLGLEVVAEGVEEPNQVRFLLEEGCTLAQGFYFARPMPAEQIPAVVAERRSA